MSAAPTRPKLIKLAAELQPLAAIALLLERLDRMPREASAAQYRGVAQRAAELLERAEPGAELDRLLESFPSLAELWENRHYGSSGLCRSPLDDAARAETVTAALLGRLRT